MIEYILTHFLKAFPFLGTARLGFIYSNSCLSHPGSSFQNRFQLMICFAGHHSLLEELLVRSTYVWDTESNAINNKIFKLKFDPLAQAATKV